MEWIEICKAGTWTAKNGKPVTLTTADLDAIASSYNPTDREAPLVFGHPSDEDPAFGWVEKLKRTGDILLAAFKQVPDVVKSLVKDGHYKKVSIALMPDKKTLKHVGLLGAVQPAVPGLASVKFGDGADELVVEFSNPDAVDPAKKEGEDMDKVKELEQQLADEKAKREAAENQAKAAETELSAAKSKQQASELETRIDKLVAENKILPADKAAVKTVALALGKDEGEIELSAGSGKKKTVEHLFDFLSALPDRGLLTEFSSPDGSKKETSIPGDLSKYV
ncbi:MAG: hypothetical protein ABIK15_07265 [Pseudomonadota bacterium]